MRHMKIHVGPHVAALAMLAAILTPMTFILFGLLRRLLHPTNAGSEFLLVLGSFMFAFCGLAIVFAVGIACIAFGLGYIQHVREVRQQPSEVRRSLQAIRRADSEKWSYARLAAQAPSLAIRVDKNRWMLAKEYSDVARQLGEQIHESLVFCRGNVVDVTFSSPVAEATVASWEEAESARKACPYRQGNARLSVIQSQLAYWFASRGQREYAEFLWRKESRFDASDVVNAASEVAVASAE